MKKFLIVLAATFMAASAGAQVVTSRTSFKAKTETTWYVRLGLSVNNVAGVTDDMLLENTDIDPEDGGEASVGSRVGMALDFGFNRNIGKSGLYWGMELGIGSRGASLKEKYPSYYDDDYYEEGEENKGHFSSWNLKLTPVTFGYKYSLTDNIKLDGHIGAYFSYDFAGGTKYSWGNDDDDEKMNLGDLKDSEYDFRAYDAGIQVGIGAWWKKFNLDFTYQRGFIPAAHIYEGNYNDKDIYSSNFMIRLGYAF